MLYLQFEIIYFFIGKKENKKPAASYFRGAGPLSSALWGLTSVFGMGTGMAPTPWPPASKSSASVSGTGRKRRPPQGGGRESGKGQYGQASRPISTARVSASPRLRLPPINPVVCRGPSVGSSPMGCLFSGRASRLDAFSGYPFPT